MKRKGVETMLVILWTVALVGLALYLLVTFVHVGGKQKETIYSSLNSEVANRISNAANLIQTFESGAVEIDLPAKYIISLTSKPGEGYKLYYIEVAYRSESNIANSKAFVLKEDFEIFPAIQTLRTRSKDFGIDVLGQITSKEDPGDKICIAKLENEIHIFDLDDPKYTLRDVFVKDGADLKCELK